MKTNGKRLVAAAVLATLTACDYVQQREYKDERADRHYQAAMADYSAGRLDAAAAGFEKAVKADPGNSSARFQYACLLQDKKRDWLGAICHYREFLLQEPSSDKAQLAKDRLAICEQMYANKVARGNEGAPAANPALAAEKAAAEKKCAKMVGELEAMNMRLAKLADENARLRRMLGAVGSEEGRRARQVRTNVGAEDAGGVARTIRADVGPDDSGVARTIRADIGPDEGGAARTIRADVAPDEGGTARATDVRSILDDDEGDRLKLSPDALALFNEEERADSGLTVPADVAALGTDDDGPRVALPQGRATVVKREQPKAAEPAHEEKPATYVVEEGDTLYKLALRFYGKRSAWQKIRDANKATVTTDGRIQAGQTLVLP